MKIVYKPLAKIFEEIKKINPLSDGDKFSKMLDRHLSEVRGTKSSSGTKPQDGLQFNTDEAYSALKLSDSEYYQKGLKKRTLAETFSSENSKRLKDRLQKYQYIIEAKAKKYNLDPKLLASLIRQESNFNPYAVSRCGAMGLGQLMPETARHLGVTDPFNAAQNIEGAAKYLREQLNDFGGNVNKALAAYNAGPAAVRKYGGIPPYTETQNYVRAVRSNYALISELKIFVPKKA